MSLWLAILLGVCFLFALLEYHMAASSGQGMLIRGGRNQKRKARELDNIIAEPIDNKRNLRNNELRSELVQRWCWGKCSATEVPL